MSSELDGEVLRVKTKPSGLERDGTNSVPEDVTVARHLFLGRNASNFGRSFNTNRMMLKTDLQSAFLPSTCVFASDIMENLLSLFFAK